MSHPETQERARVPRFTIVSAVYNVARYLDEFIASVEGQTFPLGHVEVVMVNDGSTDNSLDVLQAWQQRRPDLVTIVSKENGGLSSARNAGLPYIHGEWVTFTDPDDTLKPNFLSVVDQFLTDNPETQMVATRRMVFSDTTGLPSRHPLDGHFVVGSNRLRNLDHDTGHFHGHAASTFFRSELIQRENLTYDERLRATFEDGHFNSHYLLRAPAPLVGYVSDAEYNYRRRDDGTSQLDRSWSSPGRFLDVVEHGYLDLLHEGIARFGRAPSWLQGMIVYELQWYFKTNEKMAAATAAHGETLVRFHGLMAQICDLLDDVGIDTYGATGFAGLWRDILKHGYVDENWTASWAVVDKVDSGRKLMRVIYRFVGPAPTETFMVYGKEVKPAHQKIRDVHFFEKTVMQERIVWLPLGTVRIMVNGADLHLAMSEPPAPTHRLLGANIERRLGQGAVRAPERPSEDLTFFERAVRRIGRTYPVRQYFRGSWILIDRIFNADDSAEHLFTYLRKYRPAVDAWFVLERNSADYKRLSATDGKRLLAHGSLKWKLAMLNCEHLISSHIDDVIVRPREIVRMGRPRWRVTFLQHGIMKDDLSTWLNRKNIEVFVTSTRAEYESVVADHTTYRYTTREVALTGLPRFDRIREEGARIGPADRDLILIAPTWREWLSSTEPNGIGKHHVSAKEFAASEFATQWTAVVNSQELRELAERTKSKVAVLLHPNFQGTAKLDTLPHVEILHFEGENIQRLFARARVLITDYSSMFFNASYLERPVVYFQFDRDQVLSGWHLGRRGYFDYERDGFGPVTETFGDAVSAVVKAVENGPEPEALYLDRIRAAFPERDGKCCERVADAIVASAQGGAPPSAPLARRAVGKARRLAGAAKRRAVRAASRGQTA